MRDRIRFWRLRRARRLVYRSTLLVGEVYPGLILDVFDMICQTADIRDDERLALFLRLPERLRGSLWGDGIHRSSEGYRPIPPGEDSLSIAVDADARRLLGEHGITDPTHEQYLAAAQGVIDDLIEDV